MIDLDSIKKAHSRIEDIVHKTPFAYAPLLSQKSGYSVSQKRELTNHRSF